MNELLATCHWERVVVERGDVLDHGGRRVRAPRPLTRELKSGRPHTAPCYEQSLATSFEHSKVMEMWSRFRSAMLFYT